VDATYRPTHKKSIVLDRGLGSYLWDVEGKRYTDLCAGFGSLPLGHNHPGILEVLKGDSTASLPPKLMQGLGDLYPHKAKIDLIKKLHEVMPKFLTRTAFAVTGSQAVEYALKTAMLATKGSGVIAFNGSYHGLDVGALSLTNREYFRAPFKAWLQESQVSHLPFGCTVETVHAALKAQLGKGVKPAAIILEPIQGRGGIKVPETSWLLSLRKICDEWGILLIYDEVFTGLGRLGRLTTAQEVPCDLLCIGKTLGGGMPLSACMGTEQAMSAWPVCESESLHTGTFFGHPLSCAVGLKTIELVLSDGLVKRAEIQGRRLKKQLEELAAKEKKILSVRGLGLMIGVEFYRPFYAAELMDRLLAAGVVAIPCGEKGECLSISPALNIPEQVWDEALQVITHEIAKLD